MLGIVTEVAGNELKVSVMGRSGRPLKFGLATRQKVVVSFLATELHERVESLVCDLEAVEAIPGQPDAWQVQLRLPTLMPDLAEETITALHRYGRRRKRTVSPWMATFIAIMPRVQYGWRRRGRPTGETTISGSERLGSPPSLHFPIERLNN